uniref:Uncharacterized protein n=1 Tax=Sphaerodactylus townsendi TaxID=933632 RepID=A0ACB8FZR1_9SAUR
MSTHRTLLTGGAQGVEHARRQQGRGRGGGAELPAFPHPKSPPIPLRQAGLRGWPEQGSEALQGGFLQPKAPEGGGSATSPYRHLGGWGGRNCPRGPLEEHQEATFCRGAGLVERPSLILLGFPTHSVTLHRKPWDCRQVQITVLLQLNMPMRCCPGVVCSALLPRACTCAKSSSALAARRPGGGGERKHPSPHSPPSSASHQFRHTEEWAPSSQSRIEFLWL